MTTTLLLTYRDIYANLPPDTCLLLKSTLQFIYMLEKCHPDVINSIGIHAKIARVMCSFLLGECSALFTVYSFSETMFSVLLIIVMITFKI